MAEGVDLRVLEGGEGGGTKSNEEPNTKGSTMSYADRLKTNIRYDQRLKRNILDIEIEKLDTENKMVLEQTYLARLLTSLGMNVKTQTQSSHTCCLV